MTSFQNTQLLQGASYGLAIAAIVLYMKEQNTRSAILKDYDVELQLGPWYNPKLNWRILNNPTPPLGPAITARLADKFCGINDVQVSRLPLRERGTSSWSTIMSVIHMSTPSESSSKPQSVPLEPLTFHEGKLCIKISRTTLMTLFALTNARPTFSYSSASGYRSAYPSYGGQWGIAWPIGKPCVVSLAAHDSHKIETDVYPASFPVRVDKCIEMLCGIVSDGRSWKLAFPGRAKGKGPWILQEQKKGFPGAHGTRHLYNMMGGKVFEVDLLVLIPCDTKPEGNFKLEVPFLDSENGLATVFVPEEVEQLLAKALDCLPWSQLSWSMHRGLRDILLAYGTSVMNLYRSQLGTKLKEGLSTVEGSLVKMGWDENFVHDSMGEMAQSSILSAGGNSGDLVRVVVAIVEASHREGSKEMLDINKDDTDFWRESKDSKGIKTAFNPDIVVALTKFFVLEWSQELDYQLYHQLPTEVLVA